MKIQRLTLTLIYALAVVFSAACSGSRAWVGAERETLYQVSTLQSLMAGNYDGFVRVGDLRRCGDIGIGTFDRIDGEMIVLDGTVYQARYDGSVRVADDSLTVPFGTVTCFSSDISCVFGDVTDMESLLRQLTETVCGNGRNLIYAVRIDAGNFASVTVRSEVPQEKPYRPLAQVIASAQREFTYHNVGGTIVALYFPSFFAMQNVVGWHCHFISDDRTRGGHLFDFSYDGPLNVKLDVTPYFNMYMPEDSAFSHYDMNRDMSAEIEKVER